VSHASTERHGTDVAADSPNIVPDERSSPAPAVTRCSANDTEAPAVIGSCPSSELASAAVASSSDGSAIFIERPHSLA
jgi:hypothetical protein